ncbi:hypothetical protein PT285_08430 [Lactobacillus sp. ESL0791]|uniref:hypothetical protein n=1 Tax=Lactobacillus sp. ESL0791 TaxID=2983234 RepID=UPI0023F84E07|nr:hypothetical protein [Lactobacillus sp. ESL0791]MDF7639423.1 hypothetical protein [Lactobacillus sp. ESL0791]
MGFDLMILSLIIGLTCVFLATKKIHKKSWKWLFMIIGILALIAFLTLLFAPGFSHHVYDLLYNHFH